MSRRPNRREVLGAGAAGLGALALGPRALARGVVIQEQTRSDPEADSILVMLQLSGGNDGLNTVVPFADPEYSKARRRLRLATKDLLRIDARTGLHPNLKACHELFKAKRLAIVQGIGYPNPNRSHFKSMDIWHAADPTGQDLRYGWLGRACDEIDARSGRDADLAVNLSAKVPLALNGERYKPVSFQNPGTYAFNGTAAETAAFEDIAKTGSRGASNPLLAKLRRTAAEAVETSKLIRRTASGYRTPVQYPRSQVSNSLRTVASLIAGKLSTRVYYAFHNGFDTHNNQLQRHANLLQQFDQAIAAFLDDLERSGAADRVTVVVFSEFGRRVRENGSAGTDHGVAGPLFLVGKPVRGGLYGAQPSLTDLTRGDLKHTVDFRSVYATICEDCLGVDSKRVLRGDFTKLPLLA